MAITIKVKGNKDTNEYQDALDFKSLLEKSIDTKNLKGEILIVSNATLFGQETKDVDLVVLGSIENYYCKIKTKSKASNKELLDLELRKVYVDNFCFVIETKRQRAEDVVLDGTNLLVKYNKKYSDVTTQSENQKYALKSYLGDRIDMVPYICNFIWFKNMNYDSIKALLDNKEALIMNHNYLPTTFTFPFIVQLACVQHFPYTRANKNGQLDDFCSFNCVSSKDIFDPKSIESVFDVFEKVKAGAGQLTRTRVAQITNKLLGDQQYAKAIGDKLILISGRAGTGKTIKLLKIATDLALNSGSRSLILTYNHALVSDIKRTLALAEIPDGVDDYTVGVSTLHKFIYELVLGFGLVKDPLKQDANNKHVPDFILHYDKYLQELIDCIEGGLIEQREIQELMKSRHEKVAWDFILIDEAQDWGELEKKIIFTIFGSKKVIIADGIDQLIRSQKKCNWLRGLKPDVDFKKTNEKKGLRQEVNLVLFVNEFAKQAGISWEIEPKSELLGGKIVISTIGYNRELHQEQLNHCKKCQNTEYEMMFLVPPSLVKVTRQTNQWGKVIESRKFKLAEEFENMGISLWDLTNTDLRTQYVVDLNQHRLLQYESCRGLEGWTVICLELDEFIRKKMEKFVDENNTELALESFEERRRKFVYLWALIPLTRAIDTLVITIKDKNSDIYSYLRKTYEKFPDFVEWIE